MILEFGFEPNPWRAVARPLLQDPADVRGERHEAEQVLLEQLFARFRPGLREDPTGGG